MLDIPKAASKLRQMAFEGRSSGKVPDGGRGADDRKDPTVVRLPEGKGVPLPDGKTVPQPGGRVGGGSGRPHTAAKPKISTGLLIRISFVVCVIVPTVLASLYYAFIAADQYAAEAQFAVRSKESSGASFDGLSVLSGITGSAPNSSDSYIVTNFILSRDLISKIDKDLNLRQMFSRPEADFLASIDDEAPAEDLVEYWDGMVTTNFDTYSGIVNLEVKAFRPEDSVAIAQKILGYSEKLVNDLSRRARDDAVSESESEVARAENRLRLARRAVSNFRGSELRLNPVATAESRERIIASLESELAKLQTEMTVLKQVSPNSPRVASITSQITAVTQQIANVRERTNETETAKEGTLNQQLSQYEELQTEREFAEKAYVSSLASLEKARAEATTQTRYLSVFIEPHLPDIAIYPEGLRWVVVVFIASFLVWAIAGLIVAGVRDHVA